MIKSTDFISDDAKQKASTEALGMLLDVFAKEIGADLFTNLQKEYAGWDNPVNLEQFHQMLLTKAQNGDMVAVASLAMIIWNIRSGK